MLVVPEERGSASSKPIVPQMSMSQMFSLLSTHSSDIFRICLNAFRHTRNVKRYFDCFTSAVFFIQPLQYLRRVHVIIRQRSHRKPFPVDAVFRFFDDCNCMKLPINLNHHRMLIRFVTESEKIKRTKLP